MGVHLTTAIVGLSIGVWALACRMRKGLILVSNMDERQAGARWSPRRILIALGLLTVGLSGCATQEKGTVWAMPADRTEVDFDRDWHQCAVHAQLSNEAWYDNHVPARAPLDIQQNTQRSFAHKSTNSLIETCMAARGYRVQ